MAQFTPFSLSDPLCAPLFPATAVDSDMVNRITLTRDNALLWNYDPVTMQQMQTLTTTLADYMVSHPEQSFQIIVQWEEGADCNGLAQVEQAILDAGLCDDGHCRTIQPDQGF